MRIEDPKTSSIDESLEEGQIKNSDHDAIYSVKATETLNSAYPKEAQTTKPYSVKWALLLGVSAIAIFALIGLAGWAIDHFSTRGKIANYSSAGYPATNVQLGGLLKSGQQQLNQASRLSVNGQLLANGTVVLRPTTTPTNPVKGEIYYNQQNNNIYYYNGNGYVNMGNPATSLGNGTNSGVTSIDGAVGNLVTGAGLLMKSNVLSSSIQVSSSIPDISVVVDGNGVFRIKGPPQDSNGFLALSPTTAQNDSTANSSFFVNKTGSGNLMQLQNGGINVLAVNSTGSMTLSPSTNSMTAFRVQNAAGTSLFNADTSNDIVTVGSATSGGEFINNGSTLNKAKNLGDFTVNGAIGAAGSTVDVYTSFVIPQTTSGIDLSLPIPTDKTAGRITYIANTGTVSLTINGTILASGADASFLWNGSAWVSTTVTTGATAIGSLDGVAASADGATINGNTLFLQSASTTNPGLVNTTNQTFGGNKVFKSLTDSSNALQVQDASGNSVLAIDTTGTGNVIIGNNSDPSTLSFVGGSSLSRPSAPTKGQLYYDSSTNQLIQYNGNKWVSAPRTATEIVAASNSSQSEKDSADYVATGSNDQTAIQNAINALPASGGSVYLMEGTYSVTGSVSIPSNTMLSGSGSSTVIQISSSVSSNIWIFQNSDQTNGNQNISVENLTLDGNKSALAAGYQEGIYFSKVGSGSGATAIPGANINDVTAENFSSTGLDIESSANNNISKVNALNNTFEGVYLYKTTDSNFSYLHIDNTSNYAFVLNTGSQHNTLTNSEFYSNGSSLYIADSYNKLTNNVFSGSSIDYVIDVTGGNYLDISHNTITAAGAYGGLMLNHGTSNDSINGNTVTGNGAGNGIIVNLTTNNDTISGNTISNNGGGIFINGNGPQNITVSGNIISSNAGSGISMDGNNDNIVGNTIYNNGSNGISEASPANGNSISDNYITPSGSNYAISLQTGTSNTTLSNNTLVGANGILDNGTNTVYDNQINSSGNIAIAGSAGVGINTVSPASSLENTGSFINTQLNTPGAPTVTAQGTLGSSTWGYEVTATDGVGETLASSETKITNGNATLSSLNYNLIVPSRVSGAVSYKIYRTTSGGTPSSLGYIGSLQSGSSTFSFIDTGLAASGGVPASNTTGVVDIQGSGIIKSPNNTTTAFQVQNSSGSDVLNVDTANQRVSIGNLGTPTGQLYVGGQIPSRAAGSYSLNGGYAASPGALAVRGNFAYTANLSVFQVTDISNPSSPVVVGSLNVPMGVPSKMIIKGHYAFIGSGYDYGGSTGCRGYAIVDISNPAAPTLMTDPSQSICDIAVQGNYLYAIGLVGNSNVMLVYDITNPANNILVGSTVISGNYGRLLVSGSYAYVATGDNLQVINIANPSNPQIINTATISALSNNNIYDMAIHNNYLYIVDWDGVVIANVSNPNALFITKTLGSGTPSSISIQGNYAYVSNFWTNSITIYDISVPANSYIVGTFNSVDDYSVSIAIQGRYAYVGIQTFGILIFDLGGTYTQSLQSGSTETGTLQVDNNSNVSGDQNIQGSLSVGVNTSLNGNLGVSGQTILADSNNSTAALQIQNAAGENLLNVDTTNTNVNIVSGSEMISGLAIPTNLSVAVGANSGGALSGSSSTTYYYNVTAINSNGETSASQETSINGASFTPVYLLSPTLSTATTGGTLPAATYYYRTAVETANGISTASYPSPSTVTTTGSASVNTLTWSAVTGATGYIIYRSTDGTNWYSNTVSSSTTSITDDGSAYTWTTSSALPSSNTATTNTNEANLTWNAVPGATSYDIYRGTASGGEKYLANTTSTSYTDNGSATNVTSAPTVNTTAKVGIGTSSPSYNLDIQGTTGARIQTTTNTTTAFQVQNAAGTNVLAVDTTNQRVNIGNVGTPTGQLYVGNSISNSQIVGSVSLANSSSGQAASQGNYVYVLDSSSLLEVYDVSNPKVPSLVSDVNVGQNAPMHISGRYLYIFGGSTMTIVDISNPANPIVDSHTTVSGSFSTFRVEGNYLYGIYNHYPIGNYLVVFDVSNPAKPIRMGEVITPANWMDLAIKGNYAYIVEGNSPDLLVYNIADPSNPTLVTNTYTTGPGGSCSGGQLFTAAIVGNYLYAKNGNDGISLKIFNIANPSQPSLIGCVTDNNNDNAPYSTPMFINGHNLLLSENNVTSGGYMEQFDIADPTAPQLSGSIGFSGPIAGINGRYVYAVDQSSSTLDVFDIGGTYTQSLQSGSTETGSLQVDGNTNISGNTNLQGALTVGGNAFLQNNLSIAGQAIIKSSSNSSATLQIQDASGSALFNADTINKRIGFASITAPQTPNASAVGGGSLPASTTYYFEVTAMDGSGGESVPSAEISATTDSTCPSSGNCEIVVSWVAVPGAVGYRVYYGNASGLENSYFTATSTSYAMTATGGTNANPPGQSSAYADRFTSNGNVTLQSLNNSTSMFQVQNASGTNILSVDASSQRVNIGNLGTPTGQLYVGGSIPSTDSDSLSLNSASWVITNGNYAYTLSGDGLRIYNLTNPASPVLMSTTTLSGQGGMAVSGHYVYVRGEVIDVSNPSAPVVVNSNDGILSSSINPGDSLAVSGGYLYSMNFINGLQIYSIANPALPQLVGNLSTANNSDYGQGGLTVSGNYAYMVSYGAGPLQIVDISNPTTPVLTDAMSVPFTNWNTLTVSGQYAYLVGTSLVDTIDISKPSIASIVGSLNVGNYPQNLVVQGNLGYLFNNGSNILQYINLSNPASPSLISGSTSVVGSAWIGGDVAVRGRYAYLVGGGSSAMGVYNLGGEYAQLLQVGTTETGSLQVDRSATVSGNANILGDISAAGKAQIGGGLNVSGPVKLQNTTDSSSALQVQDSVGGSLFNISSASSTIDLVSGSESVSGLSTPTNLSVTAGANSGGTLSGSSSTTYYYKVAAVNANGETVASQESSITGDSFKPINGPSPTLSSASTGGGLPAATYYYRVSATTPNGSTYAYSSSPLNITTTGSTSVNTLSWTGISGASGYNVYRSTDGGTTWYVNSVSSTTTSVTDDGTGYSWAVTGNPNSSSPATTNTNEASLTWSSVPGASSYDIYRSTSSGSEQYLANVVTNSYTDTGSGTTATAAPTSNSTARVGIGVSSASQTLTVGGTVGIKTSSTTAFLVQDASGTNVLVVDSSTATVTVTGDLSLSGALTVGGEINANSNVRGIGVTVPVSATTYAVTFTTAYPDANYAVMCTPNFNSTCFVTNKSTTGFTLNFGTAAPTGATVDWLVIH